MDLEKGKEFFVGKTKDYDMFEFLDTNRQPNSRMIKKLEDSIKKNGVQIPIIVNKEKQIVDGQHRFWALKNLEYYIPYIVSHTWKNDRHTIEINNTGKSWNAMDYANYAAESGNLDVAEALKIARQWEKETAKKLRPITALEILMEGRSHSGLRTRLKNMTFKLDRTRALQVYDALGVMASYPDTVKAPYSQKIVRSIKVLNYDEGDLNEEIISIMCQESYIRSFDNEADQLEFFIDRYSKASRKYIKLKKESIRNE
jgi:hypothetical protein